MRARTRWRRAAFALIPLLGGLYAAGSASTRGSPSLVNRALADQPVVLLDAAAKCARQPFTMKVRPEACEATKYGNGVTDTFHLPTQGEWGLAWSYRCRKPNDFEAAIGLPGVDGLIPPTWVEKHGRKSHGFKMETTNWQTGYYSVPAQWRDPVDVIVNSTCSWHVRVVVGSADVVAQEVPAIPARSWYRCMERTRGTSHSNCI